MTDTPPSAALGLAQTRVFVRDLEIEAEIGVYDHEHGRRQKLIIAVELDLAPGSVEHIGDTINYELVAQHARALAAEGHVKLVETFAERLARACLSEARVIAVCVTVDKPEALAPALAGVQVRLRRI